MRLQLVRERVGLVHAIAYTHHHVDHLFGLDDARIFPHKLGGPVPIYCEAEVEETIRRVFHYAFEERTKGFPSGGVPQIEFERIEPYEPFRGARPVDPAGPARPRPVPGPGIPDRRPRLLHRRQLDPRARPGPCWKGLDTLILDALRPEPHPTHFCLDQALAAIERLRPKQAFFTHLSHSFDHQGTGATLPPRVALAYDGLTLDF